MKKHKLIYRMLNVEEVKNILQCVSIFNLRYNKENFEKYLFNYYAYHWICLYDNNIPKALCVLYYNYPKKGYIYISEIQTFESKKEYGRKLLNYVLKRYKRVWFIADPSMKKSLVKYYRSFKLDELVVKNKKAKVYTFSKNCDKEFLKLSLVLQFV